MFPSARVSESGLTVSRGTPKNGIFTRSFVSIDYFGLFLFFLRIGIVIQFFRVSLPRSELLSFLKSSTFSSQLVMRCMVLTPSFIELEANVVDSFAIGSASF